MWFPKSKLLLATGLLGLSAVFSAAAAQGVESAFGIWSDESGDSNIEVAPCEPYVCARVVWLRVPNDDEGRPKTDRHNPDETLRSRPIVGLVIMPDLQPDEKRKRLTGQVYNSRDGKTYEVRLEPNGETMKVKGCILKVLCGSQTWTRVR